MQRAFIIKLSLDSSSDLAGIADDIRDSIQEEGYEVISVAPYAAPELATDAARLSGILSSNGLEAQGLGLIAPPTGQTPL